MDYELREEQKTHKEAFERFCSKEIAPAAECVERGGTDGRETLKAHFACLAETGYLGLSFSSEHGGLGQDELLQTACDEILAKACRSTFLAAYSSAIHCGKLLEAFGRGEENARLLRGLIGGERVAALARTETGAGSDLQGMTTSIARKGGGFLLSGEKDFCVNGPMAHAFLVVARADQVKGVERGLSVFVIPCAFPGVRIGETLETFGYTGTPISKVAFNECSVQADSLLGEEGRGWEVAEASWELDALGMTSASIGIIEAGLESSLRYSQERKAFGKPIGSFQEISFKIAEMRAMLDTARLLSRKAVWLRQTGGEEVRVLLSCAKLYASEAATKCAGYGVQIHGGKGLVTRSLAGRLYRDAKYGEIGGGTSEIHRLLLAKAVLETVE